MPDTNEEMVDGRHIESNMYCVQPAATIRICEPTLVSVELSADPRERSVALCADSHELR